jgi:hypothetical protein
MFNGSTYQGNKALHLTDLKSCIKLPSIANAIKCGINIQKFKD